MKKIKSFPSKETEKKVKNAQLNTLYINMYNDDLWIRQFNQWKYLGKDTTGKAICDYEFFNVKHKKDIPI